MNLEPILRTNTTSNIPSTCPMTVVNIIIILIVATINILQWNCQGIRNKKDEILHIIDTQKISILSMQETKLWSTNEVQFPHYNCIRKDGHLNNTPHGGVAIYVHESIPFEPVTVNTTMQAVAVRANIGRLVTICNVYSSRSHSLNLNLLNALLNQLPSPVILLGDFNGYNQLWGSCTTDTRGRIIGDFIEANNLNILNDGTPTRIGYQTETAIDLTMCSPVIEPDLQWSVSTSPWDSDHCPIVITFLPNIITDSSNRTRWNTRKANWTRYRSSATWENLPEDEATAADLIDDFYERVNTAAGESIPRYITSKYYPKPWWTPAVAQSRRERERLYQRYRRDKTATNLIAWKRKRAEHKILIVKSKKESWMEFTGSINYRTPPAKIFEKVRNIKGKAKRKINIIHENNTVYSTTSEIADRLATAFSQVSSDENYSPTFLQYKNNIESEAISFDSNGEEIYNRAFTVTELESCLSKNKNTAPGPDGVSYQMLCNLPLTVKQHLIKIINRIWQTDYFPKQWEESIIIPIPKPGKNHSSPYNYRPISLTSCVCKVMEHMINERLTDYLEMHKYLTPVQCGCRRNRSTLDHLVRLESEVRRGFVRNEHVISIFFDLEKAYDMTWRYGILADMHEAGLRGSLPKFIAKFLRRRNFRVLVDDHLSDTYTQHNGVAQGSILSVTLFALKINSIIRHIEPRHNVMTSLFVDDLQVSCRGPDLAEIGQHLQQRLDEISRWSNRNGFKFSVSKTQIMHFTTNPGLHNRPQLKLGEQVLPYVESIKYLGLIWDPKLTWKPHIAKLKTDCSKLLGILRSITSHGWGADQQSSIMIYRSLIRSKIDYGCQVYGSAAPTTLNSLSSIATEAIRIATGAFKSTPTESLFILANEMPLDLRREYLSLKYYYKMRSYLDNPAHEHVVPLVLRTLFVNKRIPLPFSHRVQDMLEKYNLRKIYVKPKFSYCLTATTTPTWSLRQPVNQL